MVLRDDSVRVRLQRLEEVISTLERLCQDIGDLRTDKIGMWAVERGLQLGAEIVMDIGNHILSAHYGISPADHKDVVRQLARQKVLGQGDQDLAGRPAPPAIAPFTAPATPGSPGTPACGCSWDR